MDDTKIMKIYDFSNGDQLHHYKKALVLIFREPRDVLSTGPDNGGLRKDLEAVYNVDINPGAGMGCVMRGKTYEEHMNIIAMEDLGLDPSRCSGLCTAASMDNVSIQTLKYEKSAQKPKLLPFRSYRPQAARPEESLPVPEPMGSSSSPIRNPVRS